MADSASEIQELIRQSRAGEQTLFGELLIQYRDRLKCAVALRMDKRLYGRVDPSDIVQEAHMEASQRLDEFLQQPSVPFFVWLRFITMQKLAVVHRRHLHTKARDASREVSLDFVLDNSSSAGPPAQLATPLASPSERTLRDERLAQLEAALSQMEPIDREVIVLRHFEEMSNLEVSHVLQISPPAVSQRMRRALIHLREHLEEMFPDFREA